MKTLGLIAAMFLGMAGLPAAASAQGWRGGGHVGGHGGFHGGGGGWQGGGGGWRGAGGGGGWHGRPAPAARYYGPSVHVGVGVRPVVPVRAHVWVPGYWGFRGGARVWIGGGYYAPPYDGWMWVAPNWVWNGYQWVWVEGHWAAP